MNIEFTKNMLCGPLVGPIETTECQCTFIRMEEVHENLDIFKSWNYKSNKARVWVAIKNIKNWDNRCQHFKYPYTDIPLDDPKQFYNKYLIEE